MKNITTLLAMAMLSTMSIHADNHQNRDKQLELTPQTIAGVWMHHDRSDNDCDFIQFNTDGTGTKWEAFKNAPEDQRHDVETFKYTLNGNMITFFEADGDSDTETIKMKRPNVIVIDNDTYRRKVK